MQRREIEFTPPFVALMAVGFACLLIMTCIAIIQIFNVVTLQVSLPHYANVSKFELALICLLLLIQILGALIAKFTSATSQDANPPADSYLRMGKRVRFLVFILSVLVFVTT